jgi:hypothetical protein
MATGDGTALLLIRHAGIGRAVIADALRRRWPDALGGDVGAASPSWTFTTRDAAELARARRGVEPLRIVVLAQRTADTSEHLRSTVQDSAKPLEPMPTAF